MAQLELQGLLTGAALGQMFSSVSDMLNTDTTDHQKEGRLKVGLGLGSVQSEAILVDHSLIIPDQSGPFFPDWLCVHGLLAFTVLLSTALFFAFSHSISLFATIKSQPQQR